MGMFTVTKKLKQPEQTPVIDFEVITNGSIPATLQRRIKERGYFSLDFETTSLEWFRPGERAQYAAISVCGKVSVFDLNNQTNLRLFLDDLNELLQQPYDIIGSHVKFDIHWARVPKDVYPEVRFIDTAVGAFLLNENRPVGLKQLVKSVFGVELRKFKDVLGIKTVQVPDKRTKSKTRKRTIPRLLSEVPIEEVAPYVAQDAYWAERLWFDYVLPNLQKHPNLLKNFNEIQVPLAKVLWAMERRGVEVDTEKAKQLAEVYQMEARGIDVNICSFLQEKGVEDKINFASPMQLDKLLYSTLKYKRPSFQKKRKDAEGNRITSKYHTDALCLIWLAADQGHEIARDILKLRKLNKLCNTFLDAIINKSVDGRLHTTYNQNVARTGRLSSSHPNLQNMPRNPEIRKLFIAPKGAKLIRADLSQAELRLMAHFTKDQVLIEAYTKEGRDLHTDTANEVGLIELLGYEDGRFAGKTANFSVG